MSRDMLRSGWTILAGNGENNPDDKDTEDEQGRPTAEQERPEAEEERPEAEEERPEAEEDRPEGEFVFTEEVQPGCGSEDSIL